jgi:hypothetical protein
MNSVKGLPQSVTKMLVPTRVRESVCVTTLVVVGEELMVDNQTELELGHFMVHPVHVPAHISFRDSPINAAPHIALPRARAPRSGTRTATHRPVRTSHRRVRRRPD